MKWVMSDRWRIIVADLENPENKRVVAFFRGGLRHAAAHLAQAKLAYPNHKVILAADCSVS